ncbi:hypothetical protein F5Y06DRAFT_302143 [Hypoxylon sp. FL0890]|nr:hypothetical protein F5Y06DRAFT_302143 [Hypoxylon sp. FL0890]
MPDRRHRNHSNSMLPPRNKGNPYSRTPRSHPTPKSHHSYPDAWESQDDALHHNRVDLFKKRRDSISLNRSRPTTPARPQFNAAINSELGEVNDRWRSNTPWARDRRASSSISSDIDTSDACMSPVELKNELDRYDWESQFLTKEEWLAPPTPRGRVRRMGPKQFNVEKIKAFKCWNGVQGLMYGMNSSILRDTDDRQPPEAYDPGVIFSAPFHTPGSPDEMYISNQDPHLTASPYGTINSKYRKMVVLRVFGEHVQCLPIYTHNGRGLEGKEFPKEYVSIRDLNDHCPEEDEGPYRGLLASRDSEYKGTFISGRSVVKLTEVCSHRYEAPATIEGRLDVVNSDSKRRLFDLVKLVTR